MIMIRNQPVIILGGFLITDEAYIQMAEYIARKIDYSVLVIKTSKFDWLLTNWDFGWKRILDRVDKSVKQQQKHSPTGKVTLIGHSSGGIMLRLYLSNYNLSGEIFRGAEKSNCLITLGSPHNAKRATRLRSLVEKEFPGSFYSDNVKYISIAGLLDLNSNKASLLSKITAASSYKSISGNSNDSGDGIVPLQSALLRDSKHIVLKQTCHGKLFGDKYYYAEESVNEWCEQI